MSESKLCPFVLSPLPLHDTGTESVSKILINSTRAHCSFGPREEPVAATAAFFLGGPVAALFGAPGVPPVPPGRGGERGAGGRRPQASLYKKRRYFTF